MDWRSSLTAQSRQDVILKLIEVVKLAAPSQDQAKLAELAGSTEQTIFEKAKNRQEYILLLQQKISNLQAKIAVIQKNQGSFASPSLSNQYPNNPSFMSQSAYAQSASSIPITHNVASPLVHQMPQVPLAIAPKYQPMAGNVPANLRNMVLNLQQQQAQNISNSIKSQQTAHQAIQAAKIAQKTVQMQSNMTALAPSPPIHAPSSAQASNNSPANNSISFPSLNLSEAQRSEVTEKLKQILPLYQKIDLIINYLSASEPSSKVNIQKLSQLKTLLTEQYKNVKKRIFLSPEGLDNIHDFLVKISKSAEEFHHSKISTPKQSSATPAPTQKLSSQPESISNGFKYAIEQEMSLKKSLKSESMTEILASNPFEWTSEMQMYGIEEENQISPPKSLSQTIFKDYNILFGSVEPEKENTDLIEPDLQSIDSKISNLETLGFNITRLEDFNNLQVLLVCNPAAGWSIIVHIFENSIQEWQFLDKFSLKREFLDGHSKTLDRDLLQGKGIEMIQFLKFTK